MIAEHQLLEAKSTAFSHVLFHIPVTCCHHFSSHSPYSTNNGIYCSCEL